MRAGISAAGELASPPFVRGRSLLTLSILEHSADSPALPHESDVAVETWREADGRICGYGFRVGGQDWLKLPGVAVFQLGPSGSTIRAYAEPGVSEAIVRDTFRRTALPLALQARGLEVLHASAVTCESGVIALAGRSTMGKSTLAYALSRGGFSLWADDAVPIKPLIGRVECIPIPAAIRLRPGPRAYFELDGSARRSFGRFPLTDIPEAALQPLAAVVVLERSTAVNQPVSLQQLSGATALTAVLTHAYAFTLEGDQQKSRMLQQYAALVREVPVFELRYPTGLEQLPLLLGALTSLAKDPERLRTQG